MIAVQTRYRSCCFVIDEHTLEQFKDRMKQDSVSIARLIEQFLLSYVYCLDPTFIDSTVKNRPKVRRKPYHVRLSLDIYTAFEKKTTQEKLDMNLAIEQFFINYAEFMKALRSSESESVI